MRPPTMAGLPHTHASICILMQMATTPLARTAGTAAPDRHARRRHRGSLGLRRTRARPPARRAPRASRSASARPAPTATTRSTSRRWRRATWSSSACRTARARPSATRSRTSARRSSTSAPTSGSTTAGSTASASSHATRSPARRASPTRAATRPRRSSRSRRWCGRACSTGRRRSTASRASRAPGARRPRRRTCRRCTGGVQPYSPTGHRHVGEIEQALARDRRRAAARHLHAAPRAALARARDHRVRPAARAALAGRRPRRSTATRYDGEQFVRLTQKPHPGLLHGSNAVDLGVWVDERTHTVIAAAALDNLVKGAAGQALQNANLDARPRRGPRADGARASAHERPSPSRAASAPSGIACGLKESGRPDLALIVSDGSGERGRHVHAEPRRRRTGHAEPCASCAGGRARATVVNSGNANACTGAQGDADAREMAELTAAALGFDRGRGARRLDRHHRPATGDGTAAGRASPPPPRRSRPGAATTPRTRSARPTPIRRRARRPSRWPAARCASARWRRAPG